MRCRDVAWLAIWGCGEGARVVSPVEEVPPVTEVSPVTDVIPLEAEIEPEVVDSPVTPLLAPPTGLGPMPGADYLAGVDPAWGIVDKLLAGSVGAAAWEVLSMKVEREELTSAGAVIQLYAEGIEEGVEFVPTQHYVRLRVPLITGEVISNEASSATFFICNEPGAPCLMMTSEQVTATAGTYFARRDASGAVYGGANLTTGTHSVNGVFGPVAVYDRICANRMVTRCEPMRLQVEHCSWDHGSWILMARCSDAVACEATAARCNGMASCLQQPPTCE
jgi:hypothetical protein